MGWFDDAKEKVEEAKETAKEEATRRSAEAALSMATSAVSRTVSGALESLVSSAEESLASAEDSARKRGVNLEGPDLSVGGDDLEETLAQPEEDPLGRAMRAALDEPAEVTPQPSDVFADAERVLARAREARGADPHLPPTPTTRPADPVAAALAAAAEARAIASSGGRRALAREDAARAQLEAMKRQAGMSVASGHPEESADPPETPTPKKRSL